MTHVEKIRQENQQIKSQIEALLGWDNATFCQFQFTMGYAYLYEEMVLDAMAMQELVYMKTFWNWWKNQWIKRDIQFLRDVRCMGKNISKTIYKKESIAYTYQQYHATQSIFFIPHKEVLRESYARFIGKANKEIVNG